MSRKLLANTYTSASDAQLIHPVGTRLHADSFDEHSTVQPALTLEYRQLVQSHTINTVDVVVRSYKITRQSQEYPQVYL